MSLGPGKYSVEATTAMVAAGAKTALLVVLHGRDGHGFSVSSVQPSDVVHLPSILRQVADQIERDTHPRTRP